MFTWVSWVLNTKDESWAFEEKKLIPGSGRSRISKCCAVEGRGVPSGQHHQPWQQCTVGQDREPLTGTRGAKGNRKCLEGCCSLCCHLFISMSHCDGCWCPSFSRRRVGWCPFGGHDHSVFGVGSLGPSVIFMEWRSNLWWKDWPWIGYCKTVHRSTFHPWHLALQKVVDIGSSVSISSRVLSDQIIQVLVGLDSSEGIRTSQFCEFELSSGHFPGRHLQTWKCRFLSLSRRCWKLWKLKSLIRRIHDGFLCNCPCTKLCSSICPRQAWRCLKSTLVLSISQESRRHSKWRWGS